MASSQPNINGASTPNANSHTTLDGVEIDVAQLALLLCQESSTENDTEIDELLRRLESADGMARGVESRLDDVLGNLDNLVASLEPPGETPGPGGAQSVAPPEEGTEHIKA